MSLTVGPCHSSWLSWSRQEQCWGITDHALRPTVGTAQHHLAALCFEAARMLFEIKQTEVHLYRAKLSSEFPGEIPLDLGGVLTCIHFHNMLCEAAFVGAWVSVLSFCCSMSSSLHPVSRPLLVSKPQVPQPLASLQSLGGREDLDSPPLQCVEEDVKNPCPLTQISALGLTQLFFVG